ncbi:LPD29 domain-containing protein [Streptomyces microflavus]|uniref:LPD29 domain-containing protein n=1 Tax=Streptomyces microflavus TaxID=1919 RepID=UPI0038274F97
MHTHTYAADAAYLALRLPAGTQVTYHGTSAASHGIWTVQPCACRLCTAATLLGRPARRYELYTADGKRRGPLVHVRHTSVTPTMSEDEMGEAVWAILPTKYAAAHLRRVLHDAFPGVKFSVRTGRGRDCWRISVSWTGGPGRTQVSAVAAPLRARFGPGGQRRASAIRVNVAGRPRSGVPLIEEISLHHN